MAAASLLFTHVAASLPPPWQIVQAVLADGSQLAVRLHERRVLFRPVSGDRRRPMPVWEWFHVDGAGPLSGSLRVTHWRPLEAAEVEQCA
jgi:hypothetical protein